MQRPTSAQPYGRPGDGEYWESPTQLETPHQDETCAEQNIVSSSSPVFYDSSTDISTPCRQTIARRPSTPSASDLSIIPVTPDFLCNKQEHHEQAVAPLHSPPSAGDLSFVPDTPPSRRGERRLAPLSLVSTSRSGMPMDPLGLAEQRNDFAGFPADPNNRQYELGILFLPSANETSPVHEQSRAPALSPVRPNGTGTTTAPLDRLPRKHSIKSAFSVRAASLASSSAQAPSAASASSTLNVSSEAVALWGPTSRLAGLVMLLTWAPKTHQAFIKLRLPLSFKAARKGQPKGSSFYMFIAPERVTRLMLDTATTHRPLGPDTVLLVFQCHTPPALVIPTNEHEYTFEDNRRIQSFRYLTRQTDFQVYTAFKPSKMPVSFLRQLCVAVTEHRLSTFPGQANIKRLYQGKGGRVLQGSDLSPSQPAVGEAAGAVGVGHQAEHALDDDDDGVAPPHFDSGAVISHPPAYEADAGFTAHAFENTKSSSSLFSHVKHARKLRHANTTDSAAPDDPVAIPRPSQPVDLATVTLLLDTHKREVSDMFAKQQSDVKKQIEDLFRDKFDELQQKVLQEIDVQQNTYQNSALHDHVQRLFAEYQGNVRQCLQETFATEVFTARFSFFNP